MLKTIVESLGLDLNIVLSQEAFTKPHRTIVDGRTMEARQETVLAQTIKQALLKEITPKTSINSYQVDGSPGETEV